MTHVLSEMAWPAIDRELEAGNRLVVVMTAAIEQHGPALPLGVDTLRADTIGERLADDLGCFLAPTIRPGVSGHHMAFPGTISFRESTFTAVVTDYCRSLDAHGFEEIALLTTHGGNQTTLESAADSMNEELDAHVFVPGTKATLQDVRREVMARYDVSEDEAGVHAGAAETSFILETDPHLVRRSEVVRGHVGEFDLEVVVNDGLESVTETGVLGDQTLGTRRAGRDLLDGSVTALADAIREEVDGR